MSLLFSGLGIEGARDRNARNGWFKRTRYLSPLIFYPRLACRRSRVSSPAASAHPGRILVETISFSIRSG